MMTARIKEDAAMSEYTVDQINSAILAGAKRQKLFLPETDIKQQGWYWKKNAPKVILDVEVTLDRQSPLYYVAQPGHLGKDLYVPKTGWPEITQIVQAHTIHFSGPYRELKKRKLLP